MERKPADRLWQLDGLRGLAACIVGFLFHARLLFDGGPNPLEGVPGLHWFVESGWIFVDLFFVLSGYVFAHCYLRDWQVRPGTSIGDFALARVARLWPLHLFLLLLVARVTLHAPSTNTENVILSAFMLHAWIPNSTQVLNGPAWSLSVEAVCYVIFALAAFAGPRVLKITAGVAIIVGIADIAVTGIDKVMIGRGLVGFFAGLLLCKNKIQTERVPTWALVLLTVTAFIMPPDEVGLLGTLLVAWPAALLLALRSRTLGSHLFVWLGDRSYAIYLSHVLVYLLAYDHLIPLIKPTSNIEWVLVLVICWGAILALSHALYVVIERPAQRAILDIGKGRSRVNNPT